MELKQLCEKVLDIFEIKEISALSDKLFKVVTANDTSRYNDFKSLVEDMSIDWIQKIFQYYEADRKEKKQDYTPKTIAKLTATLTQSDGSVVYDICAGSGALTIQKWALSPNKFFICEELDSKVIPYLLFNMAIRNMNGYVINRNVLTGETFKVYKLEKGTDFSIVSEVSEVPEISADEIISNPPYNIKWDAPQPLLADERFINCPIPPESNANYAFIFTAIARMKRGGKCAFILPCGCLSSSIEKECRKYLIDNGLIQKIILLPNKMFESTSIPTFICFLTNDNKSVEMYDCRQKGEQEQRAQNGQFGGASHTNRTYYKTVNIIPDALIDTLCSECESTPEFSEKVDIRQIVGNDYELIPSRYIKFIEKEEQHRNYQEIADNINFITKMRNSCKLVINETIAKSLKLDIEQFKKDKQASINIQKEMKALGIDLDVEDYIQFTKNKNEFVFKCNDREIIPEMLMQMFAVWKNQIALLNSMENKYLAELRDALLPELMSGKLDVNNVDL